LRKTTLAVIIGDPNDREPNVSLRSSHQFRRSGQRDPRRRRLLTDDLSIPVRDDLARETPVAAPHKNPVETPQKYGDSVLMDEPIRLIDLVPRRLTVFGLLLLVGLAAVAGLELLYYWASIPGVAGATTDGRIAALDLDGEGSLAVWFSSAMLSLSAAAAVIVYTVRRHRTDDYHGNYRIWLWAAMCWLLMSIDETSSLHEGFKEMMAGVTGVSPGIDGSMWWVIPYFFLLGAVGSRLLVDMWPCRLSSAALLTAGSCYAVAVVAQLQWILPESGARGVMLEEGAELGGNVLLLLAMGLHARYVILDAEGVIPPRRRRVRRRKIVEEEEEEARYEIEGTLSGEWLHVDTAHAAPQPASSRTATTRAAAKKKRKARAAAAVHPAFAEPEPEEEPVASPVQRKLTKQEKKALRKRLARERRERLRRERGEG